MTVEIKQAGGEWLVEVRGEPIGRADSELEAQALGEFWRGRLDCIARWRGLPSRQHQDLPESLTRLLAANSG